MSEARTEGRLDRLEENVGDIKATLARLEPMIVRITTTLPHLANKAELATGLSDLRAEMHAGFIGVGKLPARSEMWGMMGAMTGAFAVILTALTFLQHWLK
jgi:hypothetical protein